jgi:hypothetical protein
MNWILKQCDLNKDIEIDDMAQLTFPDIQLKSADRVFRLYTKIIKGKAYCRGEESLTLNQILPEALDNIRHPYKTLENKIDYLNKLLKTAIFYTLLKVSICIGCESAFQAISIAKSQDDYANMRKYAIVIRKFQKRLNIAISDFLDIGIYGFEEDFENKEEDDDSRLAVYNPWTREKIGDAKEDEDEEDDNYYSQYRR